MLSNNFCGSGALHVLQIRQNKLTAPVETVFIDARSHSDYVKEMCIWTFGALAATLAASE